MKTPSQDLVLCAESPHSVPAQSLLALYQVQLWTQSMACGLTEPSAVRLDLQEFEQERSAFLVAYLGRTALGCAGVVPLAADRAEIKAFYVSMPYWTGDVPHRLLHQCWRTAAGMGFDSVEILVSRTDPVLAGLVESQGFVCRHAVQTPPGHLWARPL